MKKAKEIATRIYNDICNDAYGSKIGTLDLKVRERGLKNITEAILAERQASQGYVEALEKVAEISKEIVDEIRHDPMEVSKRLRELSSDILVAIDALKPQRGEG